jgi:hypothetical protein
LLAGHDSANNKKFQEAINNLNALEKLEYIIKERFKA